jgi:hypothetical protein
LSFVEWSVNTGVILMKNNYIELHTQELKLVDMTVECGICQINKKNQNYRVSGLRKRPKFEITSEHNISETESVFVLR